MVIDLEVVINDIFNCLATKTPSFLLSGYQGSIFLRSCQLFIKKTTPQRGFCRFFLVIWKVKGLFIFLGEFFHEFGQFTDAFQGHGVVYGSPAAADAAVAFQANEPGFFGIIDEFFLKLLAG